MGREPKSLALALSASFLFVVGGASGASAVGRKGPVPPGGAAGGRGVGVSSARDEDVARFSGQRPTNKQGPAPASPRDSLASLLTAITSPPRWAASAIDRWAESGNSPSPGPLFARPLAGPVTSPFGWRYGREHTGVDIGGDTGDRVVAAAAGSIVHAGPYFGYGETVMIDHGSGFGTLYGHLSLIDAAVGQEVKQGQGIGLVGCTGACSGDHLHFEIRIDSEPVDPFPFLHDARVARPESITASPVAVAASGPSVR